MTELMSITEQLELSKFLAPSDLLPAAYQNKPANVLLAIQFGQSLGLAPMAAIQGINVIKGKPTASAQLIGGLVRRAGHKLRIQFDGKAAVCEIIRCDDPDFTYRTEWTIARAQAAGLTSNPSWQKFPDAMLKARAITECARDACPEALSGVAYTAEEIEPEGPREKPAYVQTYSVIDTHQVNVNVETGEIIEGEVVEATHPHVAVLENGAGEVTAYIDFDKDGELKAVVLDEPVVMEGNRVAPRADTSKPLEWGEIIHGETEAPAKPADEFITDKQLAFCQSKVRNWLKHNQKIEKYPVADADLCNLAHSILGQRFSYFRELTKAQASEFIEKCDHEKLAAWWNWKQDNANVS